MNLPLILQENNKVITFSSATTKAILNIPNAVLALILLPVNFFILIPVVNIMLWRLHNKLLKETEMLTKVVACLSYEDAKNVYEVLNDTIQTLTAIQNEMKPDSGQFITKGIFNKFDRINLTLNNMLDSIGSTLYVSMDKDTLLTEKEVQGLQELDDIWGDDNDEVYAHHTHHHLVKDLKTA